MPHTPLGESDCVWRVFGGIGRLALQRHPKLSAGLVVRAGLEACMHPCHRFSRCHGSRISVLPSWSLCYSFTARSRGEGDDIGAFEFL